MELIQDWHIHTFRSGCGKEENTVEAILVAAQRAGLRLVGLADHINLPEERKTFLEILKENRRDLSALSTSCQVLVGTEATMLSPQRCCIGQDMVEYLDFVMVSCNHYHLFAVEKPLSETAGSFARHHMAMIRGAIELGFVDTIAHPFLCTKCGKMAFPILKNIELKNLQEILALAGEAGVSFEIKPAHVGHAIPWFKDLVAEARRNKVRFTLGSDAHGLRPIGYPEDVQQMSPVHVCDSIGLQPADLRWEIRFPRESEETEK